MPGVKQNVFAKQTSASPEKSRVYMLIFRIIFENVQKSKIDLHCWEVDSTLVNTAQSQQMTFSKISKVAYTAGSWTPS